MGRQAMLTAVESLLSGLDEADLRRNPTSALRPAKGKLLIVMDDGDPGDPEVSLSPVTYTYWHAVPVAFAWSEPGEPGRTRLAEALAQLVSRIEADRTLGGTANWIEPTAPDTDDAGSGSGGDSAAWARFELTVEHTTSNPLI